MLKKILIMVNILFAAALGLSYISVHVSPERFWPLAFLGLVYPYLLLINLVFLTFWVLKRKRAFLVSLIIILLGLNHLKNNLGLNLKKDSNPDNATALNVITYNVRLFNRYEWTNDKAAYKNIMELIREQGSDLVCLQEFYVNRNEPPTESDLLELLPGLKYKHIHYHDMSPQNRFGIATISRYPIINSGSLRFKESLNLTIFSDILIHGDTIRIYNNHLQSFQIQDNDIAFMNELKLEYSEKQLDHAKALSDKLRYAFIERAKQVDFVSEHIRNSPHPVIVCGDFNDTPLSYAYRTMRGNLKDSFTEAGFGFGKTYGGRAPSYRIDYILHSQTINTLRYERPKVPYSDHFPVVTTLRMGDDK